MRVHENDLQIGADQWIEFISLEGRFNLAVDIDQFLTGILPLIARLETNCVAECCGFDAFDFTPEAIHSATRGLNCAPLLSICDQARRAITATASPVVSSTRMNNLVDKKTFLQLLDHIRNCIRSTDSQQDEGLRIP